MSYGGEAQCWQSWEKGVYSGQGSRESFPQEAALDLEAGGCVGVDQAKRQLQDHG